MSWLVFALLSVLGFSLANVLRRRLVIDKRVDMYAAAVMFQFIGGLIVTAIVLVRGFMLPDLSLYGINILLSGILWGLATWSLFQVFKFIEAGEATIITSTEAVVTIIAAVVFLGESFNFPKVIGTVLILAGAAYVSLQKNKLVFNKGILYGLVYALLAGVAITIDTYIVRHADALSYLVLGFFLPGVFLLIVKPKAIYKLKQFRDFSLLRKQFIFTLFYALVAIAFFLSLASGAQASQLTPITQSSVIVTVLLATIILREREQLLKKFIAACMVFVGILLLR